MQVLETNNQGFLLHLFNQGSSEEFPPENSGRDSCPQKDELTNLYTPGKGGENDSHEYA